MAAIERPTTPGDDVAADDDKKAAGSARQGAPRLAARLRRAMHRAVLARDIDALREAMDALYIDESSPLKTRSAPLDRVATYAPIVEAAILARVVARGTDVDREAKLNFKHTHAGFGVTTAEYDAVLAQLRSLKGVAAENVLEAARAVDWCEGTELHGRVKPFRHVHGALRPPPSATPP